MPADFAIQDAVKAAEARDYEEAKRICAGLIEIDPQ